MSRTAQDIERICRKLLDSCIGASALQVTLEEFQQFYETMERLTGRAPRVSLVNLETAVVAQFSEICPQHFDILQNKPFTAGLFDFIKNKDWYGPTRAPQSFGKFLWTEFRLNKGKLAVIFLLSVSVLFMIDTNEFYELTASFLLQSATVFLSLYIIFTVSQSQTLYRDISLLRLGILHTYIRHDRNITIMGILTIALTFLGSGVVSLTTMLDKVNPMPWLLLGDRIVRAAFMGVVFTMLFDTFLTVASYYLDRSRVILERDLVVDILDREYKKHYIGDHENRLQSEPPSVPMKRTSRKKPRPN